MSNVDIYLVSHNEWHHFKFTLKQKCKRMRPNFVVEFLTLLVLRIREVSDSDLGPEIDYPEVSSGFSQFLQANSGREL
jgi:hypothetical protein